MKDWVGDFAGLVDGIGSRIRYNIYVIHRQLIDD